ncbi:MAG: chemotaxis protein CheW [Alphaproteobacteria bacterium]|nr:MAG: chemotaxis protein CheW [Alphaproteobacteria bacterium]TAF13396.1 MAG: chemotaxis protein CheW [Alphaproteobacteria bacterium]TAF41881.1 MAG: chemotaxis protein CheW [Alphaproteobacteria bacterium]TAF77212.1 MAG: chemotaxis protein CheW [Alphaproteobacteria bacterium]
MSNAVQLLKKGNDATVKQSPPQSFVTMRVGGQLFGASVMVVQDVVRGQQIARIPLAPSVIEGALNLRGRIVTVINMRRRLGISERSDTGARPMHVVIDYNDELYSLLVDSVGDVLSLSSHEIDKVPVNIQASWRELAAGVTKLESELLVLFDITALLNFQ